MINKKKSILIGSVVTIFLMYILTYNYGVIIENPYNKKWISNKALNYMDKVYSEKFEIIEMKFNYSIGWLDEKGIDVKLKPLDEKAKDLTVSYSYTYNTIFGFKRFGEEGDTYRDKFIEEQIKKDFVEVFSKHFDSKDYIIRVDLFNLPLKSGMIKPSEYKGFEDFYDNYVDKNKEISKPFVEILFYNNINEENLTSFCDKLLKIKQELIYFKVFKDIPMRIIGNYDDKKINIKFSLDDFNDLESAKNYFLDKYSEIKKQKNNLVVLD